VPPSRSRSKATEPSPPLPEPAAEPEIIQAIVSDDTSSADAASPLFDFDELPPDPYADVPQNAAPPVEESAFRESIADSRLAEKKEIKDDRARAGPPTLDEWEDFFARVVLLTFMEWYVTFVFRSVDDEIVSDEDMARCVMSKEDRKAIAIPLAEFANKSSVARKHGRQVIALFESMEAILILGMWMSRVNRIARRYKPKKQKVQARADMGPVQAGSNGAGDGPVFDPNVTLYNPGVG
jgi:hypothetical protein